MDADVIVAGGGVIGTAIAWRAAAETGRDVILVDPADDGDKASLVAAGMLAPVSESAFGEEDLLALNLLAVGRFPGFAKELEDAAGQQVGLRTEGTLSVAYDSGDLAALTRLADFHRAAGQPAQQISGPECRRLEPFLAPGVAGGVLAPGDLSVDSRRYVRALRAAAARAGVRTITGAVTSIGIAMDNSAGTAMGTPMGTAMGKAADASMGIRAGAGIGARAGSGRHPSVTLSTGQVITATSVVAAAGWATGRIDGVPEAVRKALRPVKGQLLRLRHPGNLPPIATRTIRALVQGRDVYLVPRADGELVVGATQEERDDRDAIAGAVHDLLRDATTALPAVRELILAEINVGLRPGTADNGPIVGHVGHVGVGAGAGAGIGVGAGAGASGGAGAGEGLIVAAGHFRNGILLSAATADAVTALLRGEAPAPQWAPFTPARFS